jgi:hypothetical protein
VLTGRLGPVVGSADRVERAPSDLALPHAASSGQSLTGHARCLPQAVERAREIAAVLPRVVGIDVQAL